MALREVYESLDDIEEAFRPLFKEQTVDGKAVHVFDTSQFEGGTVIGTAGRKKLQDEAGGYRTKLKDAKTNLEKYTALGSIEELQEKLEKYPELEAAAAAGGSKSAEVVKQQVETRLNGEKTKWLKEIEPKLKESERNAALVAHYEQQETNRALRDAALKVIGDFKQGKLDPDAIEDALMYAERHLMAETERDEETGLLKITRIRTKDGVGVTPDVEPAAWFSELVGKKRHWLQGSEGSGSSGDGRRSPIAGGDHVHWTHEGWNMTKQGEIVKTKGKPYAESMAKLAGTVLGGPRPAPKKKAS